MTRMTPDHTRTGRLHQRPGEISSQDYDVSFEKIGFVKQIPATTNLQINSKILRIPGYFIEVNEALAKAVAGKRAV